mmetsp:Transcript_40831/g.86946  ORF Transcript_40831/g.86946 Transcript_40831/m.86946 type:complete len:200 (-) Transcript_40831:277-876(-)
MSLHHRLRGARDVCQVAGDARRTARRARAGAGNRPRLEDERVQRRTAEEGADHDQAPEALPGLRHRRVRGGFGHTVQKPLLRIPVEGVRRTGSERRVRDPHLRPGRFVGVPHRVHAIGSGALPRPAAGFAPRVRGGAGQVGRRAGHVPHVRPGHGGTKEAVSRVGSLRGGFRYKRRRRRRGVGGRHHVGAAQGGGRESI